MAGKRSKVAAAIAAVFQYLEEEQAAAAVQEAAPAPAPLFSPWGIAGRQEPMVFRTLWQGRMSRS